MRMRTRMLMLALFAIQAVSAATISYTVHLDTTSALGEFGGILFEATWTDPTPAFDVYVNGYQVLPPGSSLGGLPSDFHVGTTGLESFNSDDVEYGSGIDFSFTIDSPMLFMPAANPSTFRVWLINFPGDPIALQADLQSDGSVSLQTIPEVTVETPEPGTCALMLSGLSLAGALAVKRRCGVLRLARSRTYTATRDRS